MNEIITLTESAGQPTKLGNRWLVTIAKPGQGSTGTYTEEVLKNTGPIAFPPGTKAFFNHDPKRDVRDMVGTYEEGAFWNEEAGELQALLTPFPRYKQVLDEAGKNVEASIHASARKDHKTGYVKELLYDRGNTVDLVSFAGLEGSGLKYQVESLFAAASAASDLEEKKENKVEIEQAIEGLALQLTTLSAKFDTFVAESKAEVKGVADEAAVSDAVKTQVKEALAGYAVVEKSINDADIPAVVKESLKSLAREGEDITESLAGAVSIVAEAKKELASGPKGNRRDTVVVVDESTDSQPKNFRVGRWSK